MVDESQYDFYLAEDGDPFEAANYLGTVSYQELSEMTFWDPDDDSDDFDSGEYTIYLTEPGSTDVVFESQTLDFTYDTEYVLAIRDISGAIQAGMSVDTILNSSYVTNVTDVDADGDLDLTAGSWWGEVRIYENTGDSLTPEAGWLGSARSVIEIFAWEDIDQSDAELITIETEGLFAVPNRGRVISVQGGSAAGGWVTGPGTFEIVYSSSPKRDLAVSNWDREIGNHLYNAR